MSLADRKAVRERVRKHRQRKAEREEFAREHETQRAELVRKYGTDRVEDTEWTNRTAQIALNLLDFFAGKPSKVTQENVLECLDLLKRWHKFYEPDPATDDLWQTFMRLGYLCKAEDAVKFFERRYRQFLGVPVPEEPQPALTAPAPVQPAVIAKPVVESPKVKPEKLKILSVDDFLDQQHGIK